MAGINIKDNKIDPQLNKRRCMVLVEENPQQSQLLTSHFLTIIDNLGVFRIKLWDTINSIQNRRKYWDRYYRHQYNCHYRYISINIIAPMSTNHHHYRHQLLSLSAQIITKMQKIYFHRSISYFSEISKACLKFEVSRIFFD